MTNFEKLLKDETFELLIKDIGVNCAIYKRRRKAKIECEGHCLGCGIENWKWLQQEYEPPELKNGNDLKVGDWIMVRDDAQDGWIKRQFCYFYKDHFYCAKCESNLEEQKITCIGWIYARLPEEGE